jgi:hypothetical protein
MKPAFVASLAASLAKAQWLPQSAHWHALGQTSLLEKSCLNWMIPAQTK